MRTVDLYFYGYTWEEYAFLISSQEGIFIVYKGRLDSEGAIDIKDVLYVGYHKGIKELYDRKLFDSIRQYVDISDRIFLSYAEVPSDEKGYDLASIIARAVSPSYIEGEQISVSNIKVVCKGNCKFIPSEIVC